MALLKIRKLNGTALMPQYEHENDSGMDLISVEDIEIPTRETRLIHTGIAIELPPNTEAQIRPRSGLALKHNITILNTPGTIDEGYRGEIGVILINHGKDTFRVSRGMKIAQMVIVPIIRVKIQEVSQLTDTKRGSGGFGSTGVSVSINATR
ncbi:dUTP diphosphatase [Spirulina sp. 06S082]|uniref:dUTP diphosphatase n=1 Tax=Spirulina sp. 06S082 TaxID=3110248 RepID=UPI002B1EE0EB|nr:dUTP diphosphatase [Spirulina sp. 06S082]MEA5467264.1 dUTP diphosphatase [Spirulina sp. 06S082]